ncbi:unnamed protein product, partial [Durusdinium trenchii]
MKHPQIAEPVSKVDAPAAVHSDAPAHDSQSRFREPDSQPPRTQEGGLPESDSQWPAEVMEEAQPELFVAQREEAGRRVESHQPAVEGLLAKGKPDAPSCEQPQTPSKEDLDSAEKREEDEDTKSDDLEKRQAFKDRKPLFQVPDLYELTKGHLKDIPEIEDIKDEKAMQVISALVLK